MEKKNTLQLLFGVLIAKCHFSCFAGRESSCIWKQFLAPKAESQASEREQPWMQYKAVKRGLKLKCLDMFIKL